MQTRHIVPLNLSKLGFRYFRIILESKHFSRKFIEYVVSHPNTGYVLEGSGWSGKKRVLGIGIWATSNAEITDMATHIRTMIPDSYNVVYQSELTRLEYFAEVAGRREEMVLLDELDQKQALSPAEVDFLKLISVDGSIKTPQIAALLGVTEFQVEEMANKLKKNGVYYGVLTETTLPAGYTKFFVDTTALSNIKVESFYELLKKDEHCVYVARGNGKYNIEFEYILFDEENFMRTYGFFLNHCKRVTFDRNIFTNLFPQSKSLNVKAVQDKFVELSKTNEVYFDLKNSELWYVSHEGTKAYLDIYTDENYNEAMKTGEVGLFRDIAAYINEDDKKLNIVDLGSGDGIKARSLIEVFGEKRIKAYFPVDIQELELAQALRVHQMVSYAVHPTVLGFDKLGVRFPLAKSSSENNLYLMLGGTYGNFNSIEINHNLNLALAKDDKILIGIQCRDSISKVAINKSYLNTYVQSVAFGPLSQIGFSKEDFEPNEFDASLILQPKWLDNTLIQSFRLKKNKQILGLNLKSGTEFDTVSSWKPTVAEFRSALEQTFEVEKMFTNKHFAIAVCGKKG